MPNHRQSLSDVRVVIPTYQAGAYCAALQQALAEQGIAPRQVLVIDSSSRDGTAASFRRWGAQVEVIPTAQFNHGGTRRWASELAKPSEYLVFLTQDAIPARADALSELVAVFADARVGMAYGRQLPRPAAREIERHARLVNYPDAGETRTLEDRRRLGIKTVFSSDSFAAYRRAALEAVGGFPEDAAFGEDQIVAGMMLRSGWSLAYVAAAQVTHSHGYSIAQEFKRYFDVGLFHAQNRWLLETFGAAEGEGLKFVRSEAAHLLRHEPWAIPSAIVRTLAKYCGYRMGRLGSRWSPGLKSRLSHSPHYWKARAR